MNFLIESNNGSLLLILLSLLRECNSLQIYGEPQILIAPEYYKLFDFSFPLIKYLSIDFAVFSEPVNKFQDNRWVFDTNNLGDEDKSKYQKTSKESYSLFKFLYCSNLIYSLEEIEIIHEESFCFEDTQNELILLIEDYLLKPKVKLKAIKSKIKTSEQNEIFIKDNVNLQIPSWDNEFSISNLSQFYNDIIDQLNNLIRNSRNNSKNIDVSKILERFPFKIYLYFFNGDLFDADIELYEYLNSKIITRFYQNAELDYCLEKRCVSSMLGTTLNKGTKVKIVIYSNFENEHQDYSGIIPKRNTASCSISLSSNIISINYNYAKEFKIIKKLIEPWPGIVIKLINFEELLEKNQHLSSVSDSELAKIYDCIGKLSLDAIIDLKLSGDPLEEDYSLALDSVINDLCSDRQTFIDLCIENDINKFYMILRNFKQFNGLDKENSCLGYGLVNDNSSMNDNSEPDINKNYFDNSLLNSEDYDYYKQQIDMDRGIFNKLLKIQNKVGHFNNLTANYPRETKVLEDELLGKYSIKNKVISNIKCGLNFYN